MVIVLSESAVKSLLDIEAVLPVVEQAFIAQARGRVERPARPHFPVGIGLFDERKHQDAKSVETLSSNPAGTALTMSAYIHGRETFATKLVTIHEDNPDSSLPTVTAQIVLTEARTGQPLAFISGTYVTNVRTGSIGGLAVRELATGPVNLGVLGAGTQARWQTRAIATVTDLQSVRIFAPDETRYACAADLGEHLPDVNVAAVDSPREAIIDANVVVTATPATEPVFPGDAITPGAVVLAIGAHTPEMQELDRTTFERATRVFADIPDEVASSGDIIKTGVDPDELLELSVLFDDKCKITGRASDDEIIVVESVGTAVLDVAIAEYIYKRAIEASVGETVSLRDNRSQ
jgi:alanine dehydrogenase